MNVRDLTDIDPEVVYLCDAMNLCPGIHTIESCCGHGKAPYRIWFTILSLGNIAEKLPDLLYWFDGCHSGCYGWCCKVTTDCAKSPVTFLIEGPVGEQAYRESIRIAVLIREDMLVLYPQGGALR